MSKRSSRRARSQAVATSRGAFSSQPMFVARSLGNPRAITERKYYDSQYSAVVVATSTSFASAEADPTTLNTLCVPVTGDDYNNRTGRKIQVLSIKVNGSISMAAQADQTAADSGAAIRLLLVQDQQTNGAQLNSEDVLSSGDASSATNFFQNPAFFGRFRVLKDKRISVQNPTLTYDGTNIEQSGMIKLWKMTIKFKKPVVVHFNATNGGTIADLVDNGLHFIAGCSNVSFTPTLSYYSRVSYKEI